MKKSLFVILLTISTLLGATVAMATTVPSLETSPEKSAVSTPSSETKIGVVNANKVFLESSQVVAARADFKKKFEGREKEVNEAQKDLQKAFEAFNKNSPTMKPEEKKAEEQKIIDQQKKLQEMQINLQNDVNEAQEKVFKEFQKKFEEVVSKIAASKGLDLVLIKVAVAYNRPGLDITDEVLKVVNSK